ncbi:alpha/beta fold hydrolase [Caulobacter sp. S45]|jgi:3-oxoadipate enol-lactonase|uniref:alpha/beta fold hydrolase n=1 Tax=Caulobacter sp. S45 TaxID=1641861 RepID=UPI00131CE7D1|nr:alpha/beta hydrolase [Caulobacter sp. S45]
MAWIDANGVSLRYALRGQGGPLVVLVHEMGGCLESWDPVVALLEPRARLLAYDARGAGLSEKPTGEFSLDDLVDDLAALLDGLGLSEPAVLVGCAVGAAVAMRFATRRPERTSALVALAPAMGIEPARRPATLELAEALEREGVRSRVDLRFDHSYPLAYFEGRTDRAEVRARLLHNDSRSYAQAYRMLCGMDLSADLPRIAAPTLVLAGRQDGTRPPSLVEPVARAIPQACFEVIDSGHVMHILTPVLIAEKVGKILDILTL